MNCVRCYIGINARGLARGRSGKAYVRFYIGINAHGLERGRSGKKHMYGYLPELTPVD